MVEPHGIHVKLSRRLFWLRRVNSASVSAHQPNGYKPSNDEPYAYLFRLASNNSFAELTRHEEPTSSGRFDLLHRGNKVCLGGCALVRGGSIAAVTV